MALYHASMKNISRGSRNTVGALAYRTGCKLVDARGIEDQERTVFDYQDKEVDHVELLLPEDSPEWAKELQQEIAEDRNEGIQHLCDLVEDAEIRKDARVYKELEFALPQELTKEQNRELAKEFLQDQACGRGMAVLANFHCEQDSRTGEPKPHCHALFLTRRLEEHGLSCFKERDWDKKEMLLEMREQVAAYTNFHLQMNGFEQRVDHRSYEDRGIELLPQPKMGRNVKEMQEQGRISLTERKITFDWVKQQNDELVRDKPTLLLDLIGRESPVFSQETLEKTIHRYTCSDKTREQVRGYFEKSQELVKIDNKEMVDPWGEVKTLSFYTTRTTQERERDIFKSLSRFEKGWGDQIKDQEKSPLILCATKGQMKEVLSEEGNKGAGKTFTFDDILKSPESLGLSPVVMVRDIASLSSENMQSFLDLAQQSDIKTLMPWNSDQPLKALDLTRQRIPSLYPVFEQEHVREKAQEQEKTAGYEKDFERILSFNKDYDVEGLKFHLSSKAKNPQEFLNNALQKAFVGYVTENLQTLRENRQEADYPSTIIDAFKKEECFLKETMNDNRDLVYQMKAGHLRSVLLVTEDKPNMASEFERDMTLLKICGREGVRETYLDYARTENLSAVHSSTHNYCQDLVNSLSHENRQYLSKELNISQYLAVAEERIERERMNQPISQQTQEQSYENERVLELER